MQKIILKAGREKSLKRRHPWVFSGAVAKMPAAVDAGETVEVQSADGEFLAVAACNPQSQIVGRVWDWRERDIDAAFFLDRVARAAELRRRLLPQCDAVRLVHAEADGLPGVVIDQYGDVVVMQLTSAGAMRWREAIADAIEQTIKPKTIFERSDADVLTLEGLQPQVGLLRGAPPPPDMTVDDAGAKFEIDVPHGHTSCIMLPSVMRWNKTANADRQKLVSAAMGQPDADAGDLLDAFIAGLDMPRSLGAVNIGPEHYTRISEQAMGTPWIPRNPRKIDGPAQVREIRNC